MNNVVPLRRVSFSLSEKSVTSPYRTSEGSLRRKDWRNSDTLHPRQLVDVRKIKQQIPAANSVVRGMPSAPPRVASPPQAEKKISAARRVLALIGVGVCSIGTVAGFVSIVALGPIGIAVAAGAAALGVVLIKLATS